VANSEIFNSPVPTRLGPLWALLATTIVALLAFAGPASAETTNGGTVALPTAVESPAAESPPPAESPEESTDASPAPAAEPEDPQGVTDTVDSVTAAVDSVAATVEDNPVAAAAGKPPVSTPPPSGSSVTATVDSISTAATSAVPAGSLKDIGAVPGADRVSRIVESARQGSAETIEGIRQGSTEALAPITERLPLDPTRPALELAGLLDSVGSATVETLLAATESLPAAAAKPAAPAQLGRPAPPPGADFPLGDLLSRWDTIASGGSVAESQSLTLLELGKVASAAFGPKRPSPLREAPSSTGSDAGAALAAAAKHPGSPAPLDLPQPAPESPKAVGPGLGNAFFVPLVALLALLALAAPASQRRFRVAADFRAPTPFTCALERPG
jgi:hypothetical protein